MRLPSMLVRLHISTSQVMRAMKTYETGNKNEQITVYVMYYI
jgi:hypothetical protein